MEKVAVDPVKQAYRMLNPGAVLLVSVGEGKEDNVFTVTWNMPLRRSPGMAAILSGKGHHSYPFIEKTGEFGLNVPDLSLARAVYGCGSVSGRDVPDKFDRFGLTRQSAEEIKAPLVAEAVGNLECRVTQVVDMGASALLIAQVVAAQAAADHFSGGAWRFDNGLELIHHLGGNRFGVCSRDEVVKLK